MTRVPRVSPSVVSGARTRLRTSQWTNESVVHATLGLLVLYNRLDRRRQLGPGAHRADMAVSGGGSLRPDQHGHTVFLVATIQ